MKENKGTIWLMFITFILICVGGFVLLSVALFCTHFQCGYQTPITITTTVVLPSGAMRVEHLMMFDDVNGRYDPYNSHTGLVSLLVGGSLLDGDWRTFVFDPTTFGQLKNKLSATLTAGERWDGQFWEDRYNKYYAHITPGKVIIYTNDGTLIWEGTPLYY